MAIHFLDVKGNHHGNDQTAPPLPITSRRAADTAVSSRFGPKGCDQRPPALIECYPHVALLALLQRNYRVPYKVSRSGQYWKAEKLTRSERIERLLEQFQAIRTGLDAHIRGIPNFIPTPSELTTLASLKPVEDMLDALICAWMGIEHLEGRTVGLGDNSAAIWIPASLSE